MGDWIRLRFRDDYPGFVVTVLHAAGRPTTGLLLLSGLRAEYS